VDNRDRGKGLYDDHPRHSKFELSPGTHQQGAFDHIKLCLYKAVEYYGYCLQKVTILESESSDYAVGGVINNDALSRL
jgi:hypothetical protein